MPKMGGGGAKKKPGAAPPAKKHKKVACTCAKFACGSKAYRNAKKKNPRLKCARRGLVKRCKRCGGGRVASYADEYAEEYAEDYAEDFTEERVMSYAEEYMVPGVYMTDKFSTQASASLSPGDVPKGLPASNTATGKGKPSPTAKASPYALAPGNPLGGQDGSFPYVYDKIAFQEGGAAISPGGARFRKMSHFLNNQSSSGSINLADATPLSPMVEREMPTPHPANFAIILLAILFIVFIAMRK